MKKIIYLIEQPLDERNYERFGIQTWVDRGFNVEVWDFTPLCYPRVWKNYIEMGHNSKKFSGYFSISSKSQLRQRCLMSEKIKCFIDLTGENYCSSLTKIALVRQGATRVVCDAGVTPEHRGCQKSGIASKLKGIFATGPSKGFQRLLNIFARKLLLPFIKPGLVVVAGEKSASSVDGAYKILKAHNFDYDIYLAFAKSAGTPSGNYAVFIDQDYCFHSDFIFQEIPFLATPQKYFPAVCKSLKEISIALGIEMQVAAHPRSAYQQRTADYFEGIPIEYGRTAELIRNCKFAVCHNSTAVQHAVLFEKPLIFLTTDELNASYAGESIEMFASELGKSVINVDKDLGRVDWQKEMSINFRKYAEYRSKYIKIDGSPEFPFWEIVADHIQENLN